MSAITGKYTEPSASIDGQSFLSGLMGNPARFWTFFWGFLGLSILPFLVPYGITLTRQELYQYFPFVLLAVAYLTYLRWDKSVRGPNTKLVWLAIWTGLFLIVAAAVIHSTWLGNLAFVMFGYAFLASQRGLDGKSLYYLALPLIMLIRIPQLHAHSLVSRLQKVTSQLADLALDLMAVPHDSFANRIRLPGKELFVAEACSGIQSAFTMCFLALLIIVWQRRPLLLTPLYIAFALVFAILANTIRVTIIAVAEAWFGLDWTTGWIHDGVGYFSLAIAAGTLLSFDKLCGLLFHSVQPPVLKFGLNPFAVAWNWMLGVKSTSYNETGYSWQVNNEEKETVDVTPIHHPKVQSPYRALAIGGLTSLCGIVMLSGMVLGRSDFRPITEKDALLFDPPADLLGNRIGVLSIGGHEVVRNGNDPQLGLHADVWKCAAPQTSGQIVMSQPYIGWHELCVCYEVQEWVLDKRYNLPVPEGKPVAVGEFSKGDSLKGYLFFTAIDTDGNVPTPPSYTLYGRLLAPFIPLITDDYAETSGSAQTVMLQMWTVAEQPLDQSELIEVAQSIAEAREMARQSLVAYQQQLANK